MTRKAPTQDGPSLLDLLDEQEHGPQPCPHITAVGKNGSGWAHERDPSSPYFGEWVDSSPDCRRSAFPGTKQPFPTMGWSPKKQKDVPL